MIIIFGLDCASFNFILPLAKEGKLLNFNKVLTRGCYGTLNSVEPPSSASAWTSLLTGKKQGKHGIFDWLRIDYTPYIDRGRLINTSDIDSKTIWHILNDNGKKVGCINMPISYPTFKVNKYTVASFSRASFEKGVHPKTLVKEIKKYEADPLPFLKRNEKEKYLKEVCKSDEKLFSLFMYLRNKYKDIDLNCVVFTNLDAVTHYFFKDKQVMADYYVSLDKKLGNLLDKLNKNDILIIMSDHGAHATATRRFYFNNWLKGKNLLKLDRKRLLTLGFWFSKLHISKSSLEKILDKLGILGIVTSKLPPKTKKKIESFLPPFSYVDWKRTKAYYTKIHAHLPYEGIQINLKGKKPQGIVPRKEYNKIRESIIKQLKEIKDPRTNKKIIEWAYKAEEFYYRKHSDKMPDIILKLRDGYTGEIDIKNMLFEDFSLSLQGDHHLNGVLIVYGKDIKRKKIDGAELIDIAPTILHMLKVPIPSDMDGKVLKSIFEKNSDSYKRDVKTRNISAIELEKEHIKNALKNIKF